MSVTYIPEWVKFCLWGKAGGRCQYHGCNRPLYRDDHTKAAFNTAYIAHIIADQPNGPRGDTVLSQQLRSDITNLMLLCDAHHRLVDKVDVDGHPVARLREMKSNHEARIERLSGIDVDQHSHVILYGARIGDHAFQLTFEKAAAAMAAMVPARYPAEPRAIEIGWPSSAFSDTEPAYWAMEAEALRRKFGLLVKPRLDAAEIPHLSIFGFAPIPLLIELGRLLSDIPAADVFQLHREPADWKWRSEPTAFSYTITEPVGEHRPQVALVLALSADIRTDRVTAVLGGDVDVWVVSHANPGNDFLQSTHQLREFRRTLRDVFNRINARHRGQANLHLFPAVPVAAAVEVGRVWMPKADLPMTVYDQHRATGGFTKALDITTPPSTHQ